MNKSLAAIFGIGACAAACAAALIVPAAIGGGGLGLGAALSGASLELGIVVAATAAGLAIFLLRRQRPAARVTPLSVDTHAFAADGSCGCGPQMGRTPER